MFIPEDMQFQYDKVEERIESELARLGKAFDKAYIGISGGLDSTVVAYLAARALGSERVVGVTMNDEVTPLQDITDARRVIKNLGINHFDIDITSPYNVIATAVMHEIATKLPAEELDSISEERRRLAYANIKPRLRMAVLYFFSNIFCGQVIGTGDRSEILMGYFTKYGDGASDIMPVAELYKTQVRALGMYMAVPDNILKKKPSPQLWKGQTAESELGFDDVTADLVLHYAFDKKLSKTEVANKLHCGESLVDNILGRFNNTEHKRERPYVIKVSDILQHQHSYP